jgi:hypothetical protein
MISQVYTSTDAQKTEKAERAERELGAEEGAE